MSLEAPCGFDRGHSYGPSIGAGQPTETRSNTRAIWHLDEFVAGDARTRSARWNEEHFAFVPNRRRLATGASSKDATSAPGSVSCRSKSRPGIARSWARSPNAATSTPLPIAATTALEMIGPTPGTVIRRWLSSCSGRASISVDTAALEDGLAEIEPRLHGGGGSGERVQSRCHDRLLRQVDPRGHDEMNRPGVTGGRTFFARRPAHRVGRGCWPARTRVRDRRFPFGLAGSAAPRPLPPGWPWRCARDRRRIV
jgi:hypothetical protein